MPKTFSLDELCTHLVTEDQLLLDLPSALSLPLLGMMQNKKMSHKAQQVKQQDIIDKIQYE